VDFFLNFCVPFFLLTSVYFFWREAEGASDPTAAFTRRLPRLLVPYAAWTLIYVAARCVKLARLGAPMDRLLNPASLVAIVGAGAGAVQLYFLPLLALALGLAWMLFRLLRLAGRNERWMLPLLLAAGLVLLFLPQDSRIASATSPLGRLAAVYLDWLTWMTAVVAAAGLLARLQRATAPGRRWGWALLVIAFAIDILVVSRRVPYAWRFHSLLLASLLLAGCLKFGAARPVGRRLASLLKTSFGVYLVHHLLIEFVEMLDRRPVGRLTQPYHVGSLLLVSGAVLAGSVAFTLAVMRRPRLSRLLIGG
jgi:surface polysaccharide O-acyltransferase-like enzyme